MKRRISETTDADVQISVELWLVPSSGSFGVN